MVDVTRLQIPDPQVLVTDLPVDKELPIGCELNDDLGRERGEHEDTDEEVTCAEMAMVGDS